MRFACASCRRVFEGDSPRALGWAARHDGTRVCLDCQPGGHAKVEKDRAEQAVTTTDLELMRSIPATPAEKVARLEALARLRAKNVIR